MIRRNAGACKRWKVVSLFGFQGVEKAPPLLDEKVSRKEGIKLSLRTFFLRKKVRAFSSVGRATDS